MSRRTLGLLLTHGLVAVAAWRLARRHSMRPAWWHELQRMGDEVAWARLNAVPRTNGYAVRR